MPQMCRFCDINGSGTRRGKVRIFERRGGFGGWAWLGFGARGACLVGHVGRILSFRGEMGYNMRYGCWKDFVDLGGDDWGFLGDCGVIVGDRGAFDRDRYGR